MPKYAYVESNPACPRCAKQLTDLVSFQWGYLPGYQPRWDQVYRLNQPIRWRRCIDTIPSWTFFRGPGDNEACNAGDPREGDLYALDTQQQWLAEACPHCGVKMGGAVVEIRGGIIVSARVYEEGELILPASSGLASISATGELIAINEPQMGARSDCGAPQFWSVLDAPLAVS